MRKPVLLISGPTGTGKSALSVKIAKKLNAEIVNIDSVQVYRDLNIGSAKITLDEMQGVPHHLLDIYQPNTQGNVAEFVAQALDVIDIIQARGKLCILVGGTTMYVTALFHGLAVMPASDTKLREELEKLSDSELFHKLSELDAGSAKRLHQNDRHRVVRAIEVALLAKAPISTIQAGHGFKKANLTGLMLVLLNDRDALYADINRRAQVMLNNGLIEEVQKVSSQYGTNLSALSTIGYREVMDFCSGKISRAELPELIAMNTRRFAKRQMTFWRNEPSKRGWATEPTRLEDEVVELSGTEVTKRSKIKPFYAYRWDIDKLLSVVSARIDKILAAPEVIYLEAAKLNHK